MLWKQLTELLGMRVNLDMAKAVYSYMIMQDKKIPGTGDEGCCFLFQLHAVVRSSNIPEELGRIQYLFSDKTGTLTQNGIFKPLL